MANSDQSPIIEGILDIQFPLMDRGRLAALEGFQSLIGDYPKKNVKLELAGQIQVSSEGASSVSTASNILGYQFSNGADTLLKRGSMDSP